MNGLEWINSYIRNRRLITNFNIKTHNTQKEIKLFVRPKKLSTDSTVLRVEISNNY